jgi:hypothetical protein
LHPTDDRYRREGVIEREPMMLCSYRSRAPFAQVSERSRPLLLFGWITRTFALGESGAITVNGMV